MRAAGSAAPGARRSRSASRRRSARRASPSTARSWRSRPARARTSCSSASAAAPSSKAPLVFVGYGIEKGPDDYTSFAADDDLRGKVALVLRWEPMSEEGKSRWATGRQPWSGRIGLQARVRELAKRGVAGVLIANTPGAADPRNAELPEPGTGGRRAVDFPVAQLSTAAAERLVAAALPQGPSLLELRKRADAGRVIEALGTVTLAAEITEKQTIAENVGALLPGRGALAEEIVVIGAHLDHLGMGEFGSRSGPGKLHPGADDNASGSAALLLLADKLAASYRALPESEALRTIVLLAFSAEESGLNGSAYYCKHPIAPIAKHAFMINFDMIGRIEGKRLSVSGAKTGAGLAEFLAPYFAATPLKIVQPSGMSGASDHTPFYNAGIPVLFGIIADFHADYHTPEDVVEKLNRVDATHTIRLFHQVALGLARRAERFAHQKVGRAPRPDAPPTAAEAAPSGDPAEGEAAPRRGGGVRFGVMPGAYDEDVKDGVIVSAVTEGTPAEKAGVKAGDVIVEWNGTKLENVQQWMPLLQAGKPGDKVKVGLRRGTETLTVEAVLEASAGRR
ncbi:MAG: M28 family peptidase [Planctomycetes bacterium]|nr:M28 family peptidase [Planctomycetota bacterium]